MNLLDKFSVDLQDIFTGIITNIVWIILVALVLASKFIYAWTARRVRWGIIPKLAVSAAVAFGALCIAVDESQERLAAIVALLALYASGFFVLRGHYSAGIVDSSSTTAKGVDFASSLRMTRSRLDFLGIGASKLTSLPEFEEAVGRCTAHGNPCRLLLSPPDNEHLEALAKQNGVTSSAYQENVRASLRRIALLVRDRSMNIQVRFYPSSFGHDRQQFRLMMIDGHTCLLGWTVWGTHLGRDNPQVVLRNRSNDRKSLYFAFYEYFDQLWEQAAPADLTAYI